MGLTPLTDLRQGTYAGFKGGLYPNGSNAPPAKYARAGAAYARLVKPRDARGKPSRSGKVVLLSVGMSNATQEFSVFKAAADADARKHPRLVIVDGAQGGQTASLIRDPAARFWTVADSRLATAGVTPNQVQAVWLKEANARPTEAFPLDAERLQDDLRGVVAVLRSRYANLRLVYLSSRIYAGYASTALNPEPYAYASGFAVKWLIAERIAGRRLKGRPWLAWGPYLWADGLRPRSDGLTWACSDLRADGTHPSPGGAEKVSSLLLRFFTTSSTARGWFARPR